MSEHTAFCRSYLTSLMEVVRMFTTPAQRKSAWTWKSGKMAQFWVDGDCVWEGRACCKYDARSKGWDRYLQDKHGDEYHDRSAEVFAQLEEGYDA